MLYYTEKPTDLIESPRTISIYLEQLPSAFVFFPKNATKFKTTKYSELIFSNVVDCSSTIFRNTGAALESYFLPISLQLIKISNETSRRDEKTKILAKIQI